ncbi:sin3 binding region of histone deacetylase complex subunit SAP30 domain-containing protein [Ditylenchus destructor]|nr:sin3 binding region of histone deacetylase complex subunit SAP30 domain-containing protein [Ditylenchus destructor]
MPTTNCETELHRGAYERKYLGKERGARDCFPLGAMPIYGANLKRIVEKLAWSTNNLFGVFFMDPDCQSTSKASTEPDLIDAEFSERIRCSVITKQADSTMVPCNKFAFTPFTKQLVDVVARKHFPFYFLPQKKSHMICLAHRRMILNAPKFNENTYKLNFAQYEVSEQKEMHEFVDKFVIYEQEKNETIMDSSNKPSTSQMPNGSNKRAMTEAYNNLWKRYRAYEDEHAEFPAPKNGSNVNTLRKGQISNKRREKDIDAEPKINFEGLPAVALRRYKKFFKLPHRSGVTSKSQLLEGIREHIESVPVNQAETAAYFMYTLRNKKNRLDHPNNES